MQSEENQDGQSVYGKNVEIAEFICSIKLTFFIGQSDVCQGGTLEKALNLWLKIITVMVLVLSLPLLPWENHINIPGLNLLYFKDEDDTGLYATF